MNFFLSFLFLRIFLSSTMFLLCTFDEISVKLWLKETILLEIMHLQAEIKETIQPLIAPMLCMKWTLLTDFSKFEK